MAKNPLGYPNRKSIRLEGFDYSSEGYYFLTLCTYKRQLIFGTIENGFMMLNESGKIAQMGDGKPNGPKPGSIGALIAGYKSAVTTKINRINKTPEKKYGNIIIMTILFDQKLNINELGITSLKIWRNGK